MTAPTLPPGPAAAERPPEPPEQREPDPMGTPPPPGTPARRWWVAFLAAALAVVLVAEVGLRVFGDRLGDPQVWYSMQVQGKFAALDDLPPERQRADVVFAGSSAVMSSLDPAAFAALDGCGRSAFNAGIVGATPVMTRHWLNAEILERTQPGTVVLGITPRDLTSGAAGAESPYFSAAAVRTDGWADADRAASRVSALVRYRSVLRDVGRLRARLLPGGDADDEVAPIDGRGWSERPGASELPYAPREYRDNASATAAPARRAVADLEALVADLQDRGVRVVLARMPVADTWDSLSPGAAAGAAAADRALAGVAGRTGVELLDLTAAADTSLFVDPVHTNDAGAVRTTEELAARLSC